jgi:tetratricopeptide (TPR) repeat protein
VSRTADHLTSAQIEEYVTQSRAEAAEGQQAEIEAHLVDCESCLSRVLQTHRTHLGLLEGDGMNKTRYPGCPAEAALQELAAGISPPEDAEATAEHAAHCDFCGPLLSQYIREFSDDLDPDDVAIRKELETSKARWQRKFVRQNLIERGGFLRFWPRLAAIGAMAAIAVSIVFWQRQHDDLHKAQKLVAASFGQRRTTEARLTGTPYAPVEPARVERGPDANPDWISEPASLLEAEGILNRKRQAGELSSQWLDVEGRVSLLQGRPGGAEQATKDFEKALASDRNNPRYQIDLAVSYFERDVRADHPNLLKTIDLLTGVLKNPKLDKEDRAAALFDLALAYERSEMWDLAIATWQEYLTSSPADSWTVEAEKHLDDAKKKL